MVFNSPCLTDKKELIHHEVEMVINSPWIMPLLGTKGLASPEQTATVGLFNKATKTANYMVLEGVLMKNKDAASSRDIQLICAEFSSIQVKTQADWMLLQSSYFNPQVPTGRVVVPTGRYVVPAGKVIIIVSPGRLSLVPTGRVLSPGEPSVIFGRDFLVTTKSKVDFNVGEMRIDLTMLEEERDIDALGELIENIEEVGSLNRELVKMGKACRNKGHNVNKLTPPPPSKIEGIPPLQSIVPQPVYHPLSQKQKEKVKEALGKKYKELEESKPILEVLENYMTYKKKLDEVMMGRARLRNNEFGEEYKMSIVEHGLYKNLGLSDPIPYHSNLTMADNNQAKAMGEVKNVRIQIGYQAYLVDFLVLDIPVDKELPLLLGRLFLSTCGAVIDMGRGTMSIDDGVIRHTYFPKPKAKAVGSHSR
ncbi:putative ribonuclease H-like domain-containing protein [Tanacetum coccineum]